MAKAFTKEEKIRIKEDITDRDDPLRPAHARPVLLEARQGVLHALPHSHPRGQPALHVAVAPRRCPTARSP